VDLLTLQFLDFTADLLCHDPSDPISARLLALRPPQGQGNPRVVADASGILA